MYINHHAHGKKRGLGVQAKLCLFCYALWILNSCFEAV